MPFVPPRFAEAVRQRAYKHATYYDELKARGTGKATAWSIPVERELAIIDKYPKMFCWAFADRRKELPQPFAMDGLGVFVGWFPLIERTFERLARFPDVTVLQVKEKFGALVICAGDLNDDPGVRTLLEDAEKESVHICEFCGASGVAGPRRGPSGWFKTMCDACRAL